MPVPPEIRKQLDPAGAEPEAHAQLSAGITGPSGETHFVAANGRLHVFTRDSLIGEFERVQLDPGNPPRLEKGDFADTLIVTLENGDAHRMNVGSFERDRVAAVLDASRQAESDNEIDPPDAPMESPWADPLAGFGDRTRQREFGTGHGDDPLRDHGDYASPKDADYAAERSEDYSAERSRGYAAERSGDYSAEGGKGYAAERSTDYAAERSTGYGAGKREGYGSTGASEEESGEAALFRSSSPGCFGCILQLVLFAGGIAAFWFLHSPALYGAAEFLEVTPPEPGGGVWVVTRIVAVIAGGYVGAKLAGLVTRVARSQMWGGAVLFKDGQMVVFGPRGRWHKRFDLGQDLSWECRWFTGSKDSDDDNKRHYQAVVVIRQGGVSAALKTSTHAKQINFHVKEMAYTQLNEIPKSDGAVMLDDKTLRKVIRKLADHKGW